MSLAELEALIDDLYKFICETLSNEKLSTNANALRESLKHRIHLYRGAAAKSKSGPAPQVHAFNDELPEYGDVEEEMVEYEEFETNNATMVVHKHIEVSAPPPQPPPTPSPPQQDLTMESLLKSVVMSGSLFRKERMFMMNRKCFAAATSTTFHLFNSETDMKPALSAQLEDLVVSVPQKDSKKKDVLFEVVVTPGNKQFKFAASSSKERDSWLSVLSKNSLAPPKARSYENSSPSRSLPETPLDKDLNSFKIEEDNESVEDYEAMDSAKNEDEDIYNSLEDLTSSPVKKQPPPPPPKVSMPVPELPKTKRPLLGTPAKRPKAPPPSTPQEDDVYDDTGNCFVAKTEKTFSIESYYDDAGTGKKQIEDDQDMYYDIEELAKEMNFPPPPPEDDNIYDDTEPAPPPPPSIMKIPPRVNGNRPTLPLLTIKLQVNNSVEIKEPEQDEYDEVAPASNPARAPPPPSTNLTPVKKTAPPPPSRSTSFLFRNVQKQSSSEEPSEEYDEVGPLVASPTKVEDLSSELSSKLKDFMLRQSAKPETQKEEVKIAPVKNNWNSAKVEVKPSPKAPNWRSPPPKENVTDAKFCLVNLKPVGMPKSPTAVGKSPAPFVVNKFKPPAPPASSKPTTPTKQGLAGKVSRFEQTKNSNSCKIETEGKINMKDLIQRMEGKL